MVKQLSVLFLIGVSAVAIAQTGGKANPGSLYQDGGSNPYLDRVARKEGDILMIEIVEQSSSNFKADTAASKSIGNSASVDVVKGFFDRLFGPLTTSGSGSTTGGGSTSQTSSMAALMSVVVKEVLPNGLLVIEGTRTLVTNKDTQTFVLTGLIRAADIESDNTIESTRIAEAEIRLEARGMIADRQRKGVLTQLIDWLF